MSEEILREVKRQGRILDQSASMYAALRDRFSAGARALNIVILILSATLVGLTAFAEDILEKSGLDSLTSRFTVASIATAVFVLALVEDRLDWAGESRQYLEAHRKVSDLKQKYRGVLPRLETVPQEDLVELSKEYATLNEHLPRVPEKHFLKLKARHLRKVELSKMISAAPGSPLWLLSFKLWKSRVVDKEDSEETNP